MMKNRLNILPNSSEEEQEEAVVGRGRFPSWLHRRLPRGNQLPQMNKIVNEHRLHTVCEEAKCPNLFECWSRKTATFLVFGKECTRNCGFCSIDFSKTPKPLDLDEPRRVALSVKELDLRHVVITMVARDDLVDGGSSQLNLIIHTVREVNPGVTIEVLTSDFAGRKESWQIVLDAKPNIFNYNIETVRELSHRVRHKATYERTLEFLQFLSINRPDARLKIKSGLMVGFGETEQQVYDTLSDLKNVGCDIVTIGQYLQSHPNKLLVKNFISPEQFKKYEEHGYRIGIPYLYSGPFVRSSYNADSILQTMQNGM